MEDQGLHVYDRNRYIGSTFCEGHRLHTATYVRPTCVDETLRLNRQAWDHALGTTHPAAVMLAAALDHLSREELAVFDAEVETPWTPAY